jgi:hypothetical protein
MILKLIIKENRCKAKSTIVTENMQIPIAMSDQYATSLYEKKKETKLDARWSSKHRRKSSRMGMAE